MAPDDPRRQQGEATVLAAGLGKVSELPRGQAPLRRLDLSESGLPSRSGARKGWPGRWWKQTPGVAAYALAGLLLLAGLSAGILSTTVQGLELLLLALLAADAWGLRRRTPLLGSTRKPRAVVGWVLLVLAAVTLALSLPAK